MITKLQEGFNAEKDKYSGDTTVGTYANEILEWVLDNKDYIRKYAPFKWVGPSDNVFLLRDMLQGGTVEVEMHGGTHMLWCREDKMDDCAHIGFCWAQNDVYRELKKHGFKPPKMK